MVDLQKSADPGERIEPVRSRPSVGRLAGLVWSLLFNSIKLLPRHNGSQLAAAMAYYGLFSIFPAGIAIAAIGGLFLNDAGTRTELVDYLFRELPIDQAQGRGDIVSLVDGVAGNAGALGAIGVVGLVISASALLGAARAAVNRIFGGTVTRGALRGKGIDIALLFSLGLLFILSFAATLIGSLDIPLGGSFGELVSAVLGAGGALLPLALTAFVIGALYRILPVQHPPLAQTWPGIVFATLGIELLKRLFSIYLGNFADYSAIYGSLGAVIAFMFFAYLASLVFLVGAEMAAIWPAVRRGDFDDPDADPIPRQIRDALLGLFKRNEQEREPDRWSRLRRPPR